MTRPTIIKQANPFRDFVVDDRRDDPPANGASRQGDPWPCHLDETFSQIHEEGEGSGYEPADSGHAAVQQARTGRDVGAPPEAPVKPPAAAALRWHGEYTPFADRPSWLGNGAQERRSARSTSPGPSYSGLRSPAAALPGRVAFCSWQPRAHRKFRFGLIRLFRRRLSHNAAQALTPAACHSPGLMKSRS
jgi:hypothetical protein